MPKIGAEVRVNLSLKRKIFLLGIGGTLTIAIVSLVLLTLLSSKLKELEDIEKNDFHVAREINMLAVEFKKQVQEWKNVLLRGHNEKDLTKYWSRFEALQMSIQKDGSNLKGRVSGETNERLNDFLDAHKSIFPKYQQAYRTFLENDFNHKLGDTLVRGIDREPTQKLEQAVGLIEKEVETKSSQVSRASDKIMVASFVVVLLVSVICGVFAYILGTFSLSRPLMRISDALNKVAGGQYNIQIEINSKDELGKIADDINLLKKVLANSYCEINTSLQSLREADLSLSEITEELLNGTQSQYSRTDSAASAMVEMSTTSREIAQQASEASKATDSANSAATDGKQVMAEAIDTMRKTADRIASSNAVIAELDKNTAEVGTVLDVIRGIAEQTNLLALNAAIEAARAGEQGRGFAVVADEVRTLAQRTQESTAEINTIIESVQSGVKDAVSAIETGRLQSAASMEQVSHAGEKLNLINGSIHQINDVIQFISSAAHQQANVTEEITQSISDITDIANTTASQAQKVSHCSSQLRSTREGLERLVASMQK